MPFYNYQNTETGEIWTEERKMSAMLDGVDGVKIIQLLSAAHIGDPSVHGVNARTRNKDFNNHIMPRIKRNSYGAKF